MASFGYLFGYLALERSNQVPRGLLQFDNADTTNKQISILEINQIIYVCLFFGVLNFYIYKFFIFLKTIGNLVGYSENIQPHNMT